MLPSTRESKHLCEAVLFHTRNIGCEWKLSICLFVTQTPSNKRQATSNKQQYALKFRWHPWLHVWRCKRNSETSLPPGSDSGSVRNKPDVTKERVAVTMWGRYVGRVQIARWMLFPWIPYMWQKTFSVGFLRRTQTEISQRWQPLSILRLMILSLMMIIVTEMHRHFYPHQWTILQLHHLYQYGWSLGVEPIALVLFALPPPVELQEHW